MTRALQSSSFRRLWASETLAVSGQQVSVLALPLLAVTTLQATPAQMGALVALQGLPILLFSLYAGLLVDRVHRVRLMAAVNVARAAAVAGLLVAALLNALSFGLLCVVAFALGALGVIYNVAYQSVVPDLVPQGALADANAKLETSRSGADGVGPGVAGWLLGAAGYTAALGLNAVVYLLSALALFRMPHTRRRAPPSGSVTGQVREGFSYVLSHPVIRPLMLCAATLNLAKGILDAVLVYYLAKTLSLTPTQIGLVFMGSNAGFLCGALFGERLAQRLGIGRASVLGAALAGLGLLLLPAATGAGALALPLFVVARFIFGFGELMFYVQHITLRQSVTPDHLQGRMHSVIRFLAGGMFPIGALLGGLLGQRFGQTPALLIAGAVGSASALWLLRSAVPALHHRLPSAVDAAADG
ncbi:MFS transporter [Deinococcus sp. Arct2-2]|uniref:MFS transporter n=1 Tax=Deinococcus sp. Arct2-2 TaxID=2568653 RepID=UPI001454CE5E|nr:MFS transporter [Deinococcus sp. Arct2-2]